MSIRNQRLLLFFCIFCIFLVIFYEEIANFYQFLRIHLQQWQNQYRRSITYILRDLRHEQNWSVWLSLISMGFAYGVLHAAAPGHGKIIISTFLLTQPSNYRSAALLSIGGALLQGLSAILWVAITLGVLQWLIRDALEQIIWAERLSFLSIMAVGFYLIGRERKPKTHCHCIHHHKQTHAMTLFAVGMRPCSGTILSLAVAASWNMWSVGIAMTIAISVGTALTVLVLASLTILGRENIAQRLIIKENQIINAKRWLIFIGGGLLIFLGGMMFAGSF